MYTTPSPPREVFIEHTQLSKEEQFLKQHALDLAFVRGE
jgi:hypothetical protein